MNNELFSKINNENIKKRLNKEIDQSNLTKTNIGKHVGVSTSMVSKYKNTKKMPSLETFARICAVLKLDANYVLGIRDFEDE